VFGAGGLDNGSRREINGDTVFEIGSITKTFTTLLLQDMVERGEMKLEDPVSRFLPEAVKMPTRNAKGITLLDLATHMSGLPRDIGGIRSQNRDNPFDHNADQLYEFLSGYPLATDPGASFLYSNLAMGLLGHAIALKAGADYETLVVERICSPLHMDSTRATLTPELKARMALGHNAQGNRAANFDFQFHTMTGCGGLRSTANDLLKYVSAQVGLTQSGLTPVMEKTHVIRHRGVATYGNTAMPWVDCGQSEQTGMELLGHAGGTAGYSAFIGFDRHRRRGVVVLFNRQDGEQGGVHTQTLGWLLLEGVRLTPRVTASLFPPVSGELVGIGVQLRFDPPTRTLRIEKVLPNTPASRAGLTGGLIVRKIDDILTAGNNLDLYASLIRGKAGTKVLLELVNPDRMETSTVELTRQGFARPSSRAN
jgi:CubicO group peptidase (beta-lactamase class C family)